MCLGMHSKINALTWDHCTLPTYSQPMDINKPVMWTYSINYIFSQSKLMCNPSYVVIALWLVRHKLMVVNHYSTGYYKSNYYLQLYTHDELSLHCSYAFRQWGILRHLLQLTLLETAPFNRPVLTHIQEVFT